MNKIAVLVLTVVIASVTAQAQGLLGIKMENNEAKEYMAQKNKAQLQDTLEMKANQVALETIQSIQKTDVTDQKAVLLAGKKATKVLELLQLNNPQYKKEIGFIIQFHNSLLNANSVSKNADVVIEHFYFQQEQLQLAIKDLAQKDAQLANTVDEVVNHAYWINVQHQGYNLDGIIKLAHDTFPMLAWTDDELK